MLSQSELARYSRQLQIPELGEEGQRKLKESHVVIVGVGGLGCPSSIYLTCVGIGHITIIDFDVVELSDLNRQILYGEEDIGEKKVIVAQRKLSKLNPTVEIKPVFGKVTDKNAADFIRDAQVVIDGVDNFATRFVLNSACVETRIPYIYGGVSGLNGMATTIIPGETPCLACIYRRRPEREDIIPVLGVIPAIIANFQVLETIKLITGMGTLLAGKLLLFQGENTLLSLHNLSKRENCEVCDRR